MTQLLPHHVRLLTLHTYSAKSIVEVITGERAWTPCCRQVSRTRRGLQTSLDHDALADVAQGVGNAARRRLAAEHMAHVLARHAIACHIREVPARVHKDYRISYYR